MEKGAKFNLGEMLDTEKQYIDKVTKGYFKLLNRNRSADRKVKQMVVKEKTTDIITAYENYDLLDYLGTQMSKKFGKNTKAHEDFFYALAEAVFELKKLI